MTYTEKTTDLYGFEDYNIVPLRDSYFKASYTLGLPYSYERSAGSYIINKDLPVKVEAVSNFKYDWIRNVAFTPDLCVNHSEILNTAKKVYVHPSCKLSRSMMAEKYKKSLNPYLSDAVVVPNPDFEELHLINVALFINESAKLIGKVILDEDNPDVIAKLKAANMGTKFQDLMTCTIEFSQRRYQPTHLLESELMFIGEILYIPNTQSYVLDILTNRIPVDKIVFEDSVQQSLSNETNQLSFDSLTSIKDMLESSDDDTVSAGLKSLSMMDWMHYPNSIKYMLSMVSDKWKWVYNKAMNSTSVKFMLKSISPGIRKRTWYPGNFDKDIYEEDFELFKQLKMHYENVTPETILNYLRFEPFIGISSEGIVTPNYKQHTA